MGDEEFVEQLTELQRRQGVCLEALNAAWSEAAQLGAWTSLRDYRDAAREVERAARAYTNSLTATLEFIDMQ